MDPSVYNAEMRSDRWERKHWLGGIYYECWLLLEKEDALYADHMRGIDFGRGYGVKPKKASEILLPPEAFDAFKEVVGAERWAVS